LNYVGPIAWKATGFGKPLPLHINPGFRTCRFKCNLRHYSGGGVGVGACGGALHVGIKLTHNP
jgi:hypothetical protein